MDNNTQEIYKQMGNDEFDGEINDEELVLELLTFSTIPLLYMTENIQKDIGFHRRAVKINGMAIVWDVFVCGKEILLDVNENPKCFRFFNCSWRNDEKIASRAIQLYPENNLFYTDYDGYNLRNRMVKKN